jgi:hypothetical protein
MPGDCSIYSDKFWVLLEKYGRFEIEPGVYPYHPACMEAREEGIPVACAAAIAFLYPNGAIGFAMWVVDPCAPEGWRLYGQDEPPCPASEEA